MSDKKEVIFAKTLEQVRETAREQGGCIEEEQVREAFREQNLSESQLQLVFDYLTKHKIGIGTPPDPEGYLSEEERNYLQDYLRELAEIPTYSDGEVRAFTISAMAGEAEAKQKLIRHYLRCVTDVAKLYAGQGVLLEDLIGEGNVALAAGVDMLGCLESPAEAPGMLAMRMMDGMEESIRENADNRRLDQRIEDKVNLVADKAGQLAGELRRRVTPEELAAETGLSLKSIREACRMSGYQIEDIT